MTELIGQATRFGLIGIAATIVHVVVALLMHDGFGLSPLWANAVAFLTAWTVSYAGNWIWTFGARTTHDYSVPRYFIVALCGFCLNQLIVFVTTGLWGWPFWAALIPVVVIVPLVGFIASRYWAYRQTEVA